MSDTNQPRPEDSGLDGRVRATVDTWKRKLLDLSGRNRALNFKPTKVSTITVTDEQPAEVFRRLYLKELSMRFKAAPEGDSGAVEQNGSLDLRPVAIQSELDEESGDDAPSGVDFVPYDPSSLDERHRDDFLQTTAVAEALDKSLRRIDEQARLSLEELGVNTLFLTLGMLHYKESAASDIVLRAPLILLPVQLERKSARAGYTVVVGDDEPMVNPALREYLKRSFGISLPEIPPSDQIAETYDLQDFFEATRLAVAAQQGWAVKTEVFIALFSFQKFVMYKDLESNSKAFEKHRLIHKLVNRTGTAVIGMPAEIRDMKLDAEFPPETTSQVVDADSSQLRALVAVARGHDVVIEGPPGTGKSQTIANLIAQALAADKSVLFVAEKMAALQVVHHRLVQAGLGEFCLELHSTKAQKRQVIQTLATAIDASLQPVVAPTGSTQRLPQVRASLNEYVNAVHTPSGVLDMSPYRAYGELGAVLNAPRLQWSGDASKIAHEQLRDVCRDLQDLAAQAEHVGLLASHPWRETSKTFYSPSDLETIGDIAERVVDALAVLVEHARTTETALHLAPIQTFGDIRAAKAVAAAMSQSPGAPQNVLLSDSWNAPPAEATDLIRRVRLLADLRTDLLSRLTEDALDRNHAEDIAYIERKTEGLFGFLAVLDRRYRAIKRRWKGYSVEKAGSLIDQAKDMRRVDQYLFERDAVRGFASTGQSLFGATWQADQSDVVVLERYVAWVVAFRAVCLEHHLSAQAVQLACSPRPDVTTAQLLDSRATAASSALGELIGAVGWPESHFEGMEFSGVSERVDNLRDHLSLAPQWAGFEQARQVVESGPASEFLPAALSGKVECGDLPAAFRRTFFMKWLSQVVQERPPLARFQSLTHEERITEFQNLDSRVLLENRAALVGSLRDRAQHKLQQPAAAAALPFLQREMAKQRNLSPLRKTLQHADAAIRAIKPCFLMSPLTVAQYIPGGEPAFDLVIFDEASQLPSEDAVGSIVRGRQLAVVGDPKQLPPTAFFSSSLEMGEVYAPDGTPIYQDAESVLEEFMGAGLPMSRLKWHYRSAHETLITFSNVSFYDADLYTFPSVEIGVGRQGLSFEYVEGGRYEGKGLNALEARRVADEVVRFAREQIARRDAGETMVSLGVGTFNLRQQVAIQDELEARRRADSRIEPFFDRSLPEPFFVKNLENIQGDERDVIFISVTYARGVDGQLHYRFGPLNGQNGWRRLNVLTTRARRQMRVFSSMRGDEISPAATTSDGPRLLREFLTYAEHGRLESKMAAVLAATESPFEREVVSELTQRGIKCVPQVGAAGYRIDIGILDDEVLGRFVCGVECDGVAYHSSESARDRDRLRTQVLRGRGWTLLRVWSTDWFKDRAGQIARLVKSIDTMRARVKEEAVAEQETKRQAVFELRASAESPVIEPQEREDPQTQYRRPTAPLYRIADGQGQFGSAEILDASDSLISTVIRSVVDIEGPLHIADLMTRVASMWDTKAGSRVQARIQSAAVRAPGIRRRGDFVWGPSDACTVRSRADAKIPADRIAPEEFDQAVMLVLGGGHSLPRPTLTTEVRSVFGYARTGGIIEEAVSDSISRLLSAEIIGEGSAGLKLRGN